MKNRLVYPVTASICIVLLSADYVLAGQRIKVQIESSYDKSVQPSYVILPDHFRPNGNPVALVVSLHSWSADLEQRNSALEAEANRLGWIYLFPNFRGRNDQPEACGSEAAQQDILDAIAWCRRSYPIDEKRIYVTGNSGGGHMTMLMAARHPELFAAASAWVGISDLRDWYVTQNEKGSRYAGEIVSSCGGRPGDSPRVDRQYRNRSPITYLHRATTIPLDIAAGVHDGHQGSVPVRHSLNAFNAIAASNQTDQITQDEIEQISRVNGRLEQPQSTDQGTDPDFGRDYYLRRISGKARITIFEGGHEGIAKAAVMWLEAHRKE